MYTLKIPVVVSLTASVFLLLSCASIPGGTSGGKRNPVSTAPAWVANPRTVFPENQFVSAVGTGSDRENAEKNALTALIQIFGQQIRGETTVSSRYAEAVQDGRIVLEDTSAIDRSITTSVNMGAVIGAEIKDVWNDGSVYSAVAVMDKAKATMIYRDLVDQNDSTIRRLVEIPVAERSTLDAFARYDLAAEIADTNGTFINLLSVINPAIAATKRDSFRTGDQFRLETLRIAQEIPIGIVVAGDDSGRVQAAFASAITAAGFKAGTADSRYVLTVRYQILPVELINQPNKFVRYQIEARLTDTTKNTTLLPYTVSGREGHITLVEAEQRALRVSEEKVRDDFGRQFRLFLSTIGSRR